MLAFHGRAIETSGTTDQSTQRHCPYVGRPPLVGVRDGGFSTLLASLKALTPSATRGRAFPR